MNRKQMNFKTLYMAKIQAIALSMFYPNGRWLVYENADGYHLSYDECKVRDGVPEISVFQAASNCNSGTLDYSVCRKIAEEKLF